MIDVAIALARAKDVQSVLRHPNRGAFQKRIPRFIHEAKARAKKRRWPFNAPRPQQAAGDEAQTTTKERKPSSLEGNVDDLFADFDGVHAATRAESDSSSYLVHSKRYPPSTGWASGGIGMRRSDPVPARKQSSIKLGEDAGHPRESKYEYVRDLMPGAPNPVALVKHKASGKLMVMKTLKVGTGKTDLGAAIEAYTLEKLVKPHRNIVELHEAFFVETPPVCKMVVEYCSGGDVFDFSKYWMIDKKEKVPEMFLLHFIASMGEALGYLHLGCRFRPSSNGVGLATVEQDPEHQPVLHRDIKPENIFLRWSSQNKYGMPDIVLGDFGGAVLDSESRACYGTPGYYPPEVLRFLELKDTDPDAYRRACDTKVMTRASDMYTFGRCLWWMIDENEIKPSTDFRPAFNTSNISHWPLLLDLLTDALADKPQDRLTTSILFDWANVLNVHVQHLYQNGVRMPENLWPNPPPSKGGNRHDSVHSKPSVYSEDREVGAENDDQASDTSGVSDFCWCPNHRSISSRHPRPDCISKQGKPSDWLLSNARATRTYDAILAAESDDTVVGCSRDALRRGWRPQSHQAELVSGFSDDSDSTVCRAPSR